MINQSSSISGLFSLAALAVLSGHHHNSNYDDYDRPCDLYETIRQNADSSQKEINTKDKQKHWLYHVVAALACLALWIVLVILHFCVISYFYDL